MNTKITLNVSSLIVIDALRESQRLEVYKAITNHAIGNRYKFKDENAKLIFETIKRQIKITDQKKAKAKKRTIKEREKEFYNSLIPFLKDYSKKMIREFFDYWTEKGDKDKKMRFEKEKSFSTSRRLKTWEKNQEKFGNKKEEKPSSGIKIQEHPDL